MKIRNILTGTLASLLLLTGCEVDKLEYKNPADVSTLIVYGCLASDEESVFSSEINPQEGTIVVQVPYYISETEEIMADRTSMKLRAQMPTGAKFSPSLEGIHDLTKPFETVYSDNQGYVQRFKITADAVKSKEAKITKLYFKDLPNATVVIEDPTEVGKHGIIRVYQTSGAIVAAMENSIVEKSSWSTIECTGYDAATGKLDLSALPPITIVSQDGEHKTVYDLVMDTPQFVDYGLGYTSPLFAMQLYPDNTLGFEADANKTIAVVDNYLIISNAKDVDKMIVLNRFSGEKADVKVNTTGMDKSRSYYAICSDDADHLITMTFVSTFANNETESKDVFIYVWLDGIENAPTRVLYANLMGGYFQNAPYGVNKVTAMDLGYTLNCKGDVTGEAVLCFSAYRVPRPVFIQFTDGKIADKAYIEWSGGTVSMWTSSNIVPLTTKAPYSYIWHTGNWRDQIMYVPKGTSGNRAVVFGIPGSHWWSGSNSCIHGVAYTEFNGAHLLAAINGNAPTGGAGRFYLSDISANPTTSSLVDGFIFDSREGNKIGDETKGGPKGTGYGVSGMTSPYSYVSGKTVLGTNKDEMGSIVFGRSADDSSVQLYMFVPDQGLIAYELTKFDM